MSEVIDSLESNNPSACQNELSQLRTLVVGPNPLSARAEDHKINYQNLGITDCLPGDDYPLAILLSLTVNNVKTWRKDGHPVYRNNALLDILPHNPVQDTNAALDIYEPLLEGIVRAGSVLAGICLLSVR